MSVPNHGIPDGNYKPSLSVIDQTTHIPFAVIGDSNLGVAYIQIVDNTGAPIVSFGGGTQYTDGGTPPVHPIGSTIEWSDGTHWQTVSAANPLPVTASLNPTGLALDATLTGGTQQTKLTDGTNIANILKSDGTAAGQNAQMISGSRQEQTFSISSNTTSTAWDVGNYREISVHITSQGTGARVNFQGSNDNTNWSSIVLTDITNNAQGTTNTSTSSTTAGGIWFGPIPFRYFRVNITTLSAGTSAGTVEFFTLGGNPSTMSVTTTNGTGSAVPANAFYMGVKSGANLVGLVLGQALMASSLPVSIASDQGAVPVSGTFWQATQPISGNVGIASQTTGGYTPGKLISAATTNATSVKGSAGTLGGLQLVGNTATVYYVKLYDKASAPTVGSDTPIATYIVPANSTNGAGSNIPLPAAGVAFANGIALAITGAVTDADTTACAANAVAVNYQYK